MSDVRTLTLNFDFSISKTYSGNMGEMVAVDCSLLINGQGADSTLPPYYLTPPVPAFIPDTVSKSDLYKWSFVEGYKMALKNLREHLDQAELTIDVSRNQPEG